MPALRETEQVGKREDLSDIITLADVKETPFISMIKKGKRLTNMLFEAQMDAYGAVKTDGVIDGTDVQVFEKDANRAKFGCRAQWWRRAPMVTTLAEEVSEVAGVPSEMGRAKAKALVQMKRDMEATVLSNNESQADTGVQPYKTRGLGKWIQNEAQADLPVPAGFRTPLNQIYSGTLAAFEEDNLRAILQARWENIGGSANLVGIVGSGIKNKISDFSRYEPNKTGYTPIRRFDGAVSGGKISSTVDFYEGDYGSVEVMLDNYLPNQNTGYLLDLDFVELRPHTNPFFRNLPDLDGGPRGVIRAIAGLAVTNTLAHAKIVAT